MTVYDDLDDVGPDEDPCPDWPAGIDLPAGQLAMTHYEWIDYITPIIDAIEGEPSLDDRADELRAVVAWHDRQHDEL